MFHFIYNSSFDNLTKLIRNLIHCTQWKHRQKLVGPFKASRDKRRVKRVNNLACELQMPS